MSGEVSDKRRWRVGVPTAHPPATSEAKRTRWSGPTWCGGSCRFSSGARCSSRLPFRQSLLGLSLRSRTLALFTLFFVLLHLAAAAPSPSNLEGLVYLRPELVGLEAFLLTQPEMLAQCSMMALGIAAWACKGVERRLPT